MIKNILLASMILILISACGPASGGSPQAWFDQPLTGTSFPLAPVSITIHATDPGGISQVQFFVIGNLVETIPNQFTNTSLAIFTTVWMPPAPGKYLLQVRAQSNAGSWSELVETVILIQGDRSDGETSQPATEQADQSSPTWTMTPSLEFPTSTFPVTPRLIPSATPTYVRPSLTPTPTYVRPSFTPTPTNSRPTFTPTRCTPGRGVICP